MIVALSSLPSADCASSTAAPARFRAPASPQTHAAPPTVSISTYRRRISIDHVGGFTKARERSLAHANLGIRFPPAGIRCHGCPAFLHLATTPSILSSSSIRQPLHLHAPSPLSCSDRCRVDDRPGGGGDHRRRRPGPDRTPGRAGPPHRQPRTEPHRNAIRDRRRRCSDGRDLVLHLPKEATQKPQVGGMINPSLEAIVALKPDLIVVSMEGNVREDFDRLTSLGAAVFGNPRSLADIRKSIGQLGALTGRERPHRGWRQASPPGRPRSSAACRVRRSGRY